MCRAGWVLVVADALSLPGLELQKQFIVPPAMFAAVAVWERKAYLAPRCPPYIFVLNSMLIFVTSFGSKSAPGPHLIHNSYRRDRQHVVFCLADVVEGCRYVGGVSEVSAEE